MQAWKRHPNLGGSTGNLLCIWNLACDDEVGRGQPVGRCQLDGRGQLTFQNGLVLSGLIAMINDESVGGFPLQTH